MSRQSHFSYSSITEPLVVKSNISTDGNLDKWFKEHPNPVLRKVLTTAILAGSLFFVEPITVPDVTGDLVPDWHPQQNQPQRLVTSLPRQHTGEYRYELVDQIFSITDWFREIQQPYFTKRRDPYTGESRFETPREILLPDWYQPASEPYFSKLRLQHYGEYRFEVPRAIFIDDWQQPISQPQRLVTSLTRLHTGDIRTEIVESTEEITVDKWFKPVIQPYFPRFKHYHSGESRFEIPRDILITDWFQPTQEPYFSKYSKRPQLLGGESRFEIPREILVTDWFQEVKQPYFPKYRFYHTGESRFEVPRTILITDWFQPIHQPVRRPTSNIVHEDYIKADVIFEIITDTEINEWYQPASEPYFSKYHRRGQVFGGEARFEVPREILIADWFREIQQPYFSKLRFYHTGESRFEVPREIIITDWFQPIGKPFFDRRRDYHTGEFRFELPREIQLDDWFNHTIQPSQHFTRRRDYQTEAIQPVEINFPIENGPIDWWVPVVQPYFPKYRNYFTGEFRFEVQREIELPDWFMPASEPYFIKRRDYFAGETRDLLIIEIPVTDWLQPTERPTLRKQGFVQSTILDPIQFFKHETELMGIGVFNLTGNDAQVYKGFYLPLERGTFALTGNNIGLVVERLIPLETGTFLLTGNDVELTSDLTIFNLETGAFQLSLNMTTRITRKFKKDPSPERSPEPGKPDKGGLYGSSPLGSDKYSGDSLSGGGLFNSDLT